MDEVTKLRCELGFSQGAESMYWRRLWLNARELDGFTPTAETTRQKIEICEEILSRLKTEVARREAVEIALYRKERTR